MTALQCERIAEMRMQNYPYSFIGQALNISPNTVKSICRRKGFVSTGKRKTKAEKQQVSICKNCRSVFTPERKDGRSFCSEKCRMAWWKENRKIIKK